VYDHPNIMSKRGPGRGRVDEIDGRAHALLLDAERRDFEKACGIYTRDAPAERCAAPAIDCDGVAGLDLNGISGEEVGHHLQIERIADVEQRGPRLSCPILDELSSERVTGSPR